MLSKKDFKAPKGKFRVIAVDTFDQEGCDWIEGDFLLKETAMLAAKEKGGEMLKTHVYDDKGNHIYHAGTF